MEKNELLVMSKRLIDLRDESRSRLDLPGLFQVSGRIAVFQNGVEIVWQGSGRPFTPDEGKYIDYCVPGALRTLGEEADLGFDVYTAHLTHNTGVLTGSITPEQLSELVSAVVPQPVQSRFAYAQVQ